MMFRHMLAAVAALVLLCAPDRAVAGEIVVLDQVGPGPNSLAGAASSSQFNPATPAVGSVTIDNFSIIEAPVRITSVEAVVAALQNFVSWSLVDSWTVQIYSSENIAVQTVIGDVYSASFSAPAKITSGYSGLFNSELAVFDVDVTLDPGDYWIGVAMGNENAVNGIVGIRGSLIGDGPAKLAVSSIGQIADLGAPGAYRITGTVVPAPASAAMLGLLLIRIRRRRS